MFGSGQRQASAKAGGKVGAKVHSIAGMLRGTSFSGRFEVGGVSYGFKYSPEKATVAAGKLELIGSFTVTDGRANARVSPPSVRNVRGTLLATQGGIGTAPPRQKLPAEISTARPDLPIVESTGSLSFCGVLYLKLSPLDGRALGVPADLRQLQLNVRLAPLSDAERNLQGVFSSIVDALYGDQINQSLADATVVELNKLLAN
jgi:hypothetical protein